jgi:hypothetical protein
MTDEEKAAAAEAADKAAKEARDAEQAEAARQAAEEAAKAAGSGSEDLAEKLKKAEDEKAKLLKEVMANKERAKTAEERAKAYEGIDPEAARKALAAQKEAETKALEDKGEYKRIIEQMNAETAKTLADKDKLVSDKDAEIATLKETINKLSIGNSFGSSKFIADELVLTPSKAEVLYGAHFEVEDGKVIAYDKPRGQKDRTPLVDGKGATLGFDQAIKKIVSADPDFERIKRSSMKAGAGSETDGKSKNEDGGKAGLSGLSRIRASLADKK